MTPFEGIIRLLIDGNNLLHRTSGTADAGAQRLLVAKLTSAMPASLETILVLDGHAASGTDRRQRIRRNLDVQHSGSVTADEMVLAMVRQATPAQRASITVVSDDRPLTEKARFLGARTKRLEWLQALLDRPAAQSVSIGRKGVRPERDEPERSPWQPGRGATKKRGNPRREKR